MSTQVENLYLYADEVRVGDILPDVSRQPVASVTVLPHESVLVTFKGTEFKRHFRFGGIEYGYECTRVLRNI